MTRNANGEGTVRLRPDGRYEARGYVQTTAGRRKRVSVFGRTRREAHDQLIARLHRDRQGVPIAAERWTVERYLHHWLENVVRTKNRPRTVELYETTIRLHIAPYLGKKPLTKLTPMDVQEAVNQLQQDGCPPRTIHKMRQVLSSALSRAEKEELVFRNVARLVDLPHYERKAIRPWTAEQASLFLQAAAGHRWEIGYQLLLLYGMRRGEVLGLRWGDIDFIRGEIHVEQQLQRIAGQLRLGPVKTTAGRRVLPLLPSIREPLLRLAAERGVHLALDDDPSRSPAADHLVLLTTEGTPVEPGNFARTFHQLHEQVGLPRITVHHTRHTAATLLKSLGVPASDAQAILGHAHVTTTQQLYQHADLDAERVALQAVEEALITGQHGATQAHDLSALGAGRGQKWGSNTHRVILGSNVNTNENRRPTGVETAEFVGGPGGDRTRDILLKSPIGASVALLPTPVICALHTRTRRIILGRVGVKMGVNLDRPLDDLLIFRRELEAAFTAKLRQLSFPLNLLPSTPLTETKEAA